MNIIYSDIPVGAANFSYASIAYSSLRHLMVFYLTALIFIQNIELQKSAKEFICLDEVSHLEKVTNNLKIRTLEDLCIL